MAKLVSLAEASRLQAWAADHHFGIAITTAKEVEELAETVLALWPIVEAVSEKPCMFSDDTEPSWECGLCLTCKARKVRKDAAAVEMSRELILKGPPPAREPSPQVKAVRPRIGSG